MSQTHSLLLELGVEELPANALQRLSTVLEKSFKLSLHEAGLNFECFQAFAAPRRLGFLIRDLDATQKDETVELRGPSVKAAFDDDGQPKKPALGFASSCGVDVEQLHRISTPKGEYLAFDQFKKGQQTIDLLDGFLKVAVKELASSKNMRWGHHLHRFLRPVRWLTYLLDTEIVPCELFGIIADRLTYGHRVHHPLDIELTHAEEYAHKLQRYGYVIPDFASRRQNIKDQVLSLAMSHTLTANPSEELIDEITGLVEWPVTLCGSFDEAYLQVPHECLVSTMEQNQKYIALYGADGRLAHAFLFVANLESKDPQTVIAGNERVIRPRFADAQFFFESDSAKSLLSLRSGLNRVIYQQQLGSLFDKTERLSQISQNIALTLKIQSDDIVLTAQLSKVDLLTAMVGEFPELQGIMGRYYAGIQGFSTELAQAMEEQYLPRGQGDALPNSSLGIVLSLADKIDSLVGLFAIGQEPSADKDPFALRRMALGIVRMCIELELDVDVQQMASQALNAYPEDIKALVSEQKLQSVAVFIMQRLPTLYRDSGIDMRLVRAVEALNIYNPCDFNKRLVVLKQFYRSEDALALAEVHKRVNNILRKNPVGDSSFKIDTDHLVEPAEINLHQALQSLEPKLVEAKQKGNYAELLQLCASVRQSVDQFFIDVKVMSDIAIQQHNRLALLSQLQGHLGQVGDLSYLVAGSK